MTEKQDLKPLECYICNKVVSRMETNKTDHILNELDSKQFQRAINDLDLVNYKGPANRFHDDITNICSRCLDEHLNRKVTAKESESVCDYCQTVTTISELTEDWHSIKSLFDIHYDSIADNLITKNLFHCFEEHFTTNEEDQLNDESFPIVYTIPILLCNKCLIRFHKTRME